MRRALRSSLVVLLGGAPDLPAQSSVQYVYDNAGRLIAVIDASGDSAVYHYDAVGNILSIDRQAASTVSIITFGPPGRGFRHDGDHCRNRLLLDAEPKHW